MLTRPDAGLKTTGESYMNEFKATNVTLPICHATVTGKVCRRFEVAFWY